MKLIATIIFSLLISTSSYCQCNIDTMATAYVHKPVKIYSVTDSHGSMEFRLAAFSYFENSEFGLMLYCINKDKYIGYSIVKIEIVLSSGTSIKPVADKIDAGFTAFQLTEKQRNILSTENIRTVILSNPFVDPNSFFPKTIEISPKDSRFLRNQIGCLLIANTSR